MLRRVSRLARGLLHDGPDAYLTALSAIREYHALQRLWELASLNAVVRRLRPRVVVEIGTHRGGSLRCWARFAADDALLVSIDLPTPAEGIGQHPGDSERFAGFLRPGQRLEQLHSDSHAPATMQALRSILGEVPVDFLWIDGDHTEAGVRQDWADYSPLVRPGGIIALHDIQYNPAFPTHHVDRLWADLERTHRTHRFVDQDQPGGVGMGIGVVYV